MAYNGLDARMNRTYTQGGTTTSLTTHRAGVSATAPILKEGGANFTPGVSERRQGTTRQNSGGIKNMDLQTMPDGSFFGSRRYDAFGGHLSSTGSWFGPNGYGGSVGYQEVPQSGLKLLGHRYYDSSTGRFLTRDPIKDGGNWYSYCGNNPVTGMDPTGLAPGRALTEAETRAIEYNISIIEQHDPEAARLLREKLKNGHIRASDTPLSYPKSKLPPGAKPRSNAAALTGPDKGDGIIYITLDATYIKRGDVTSMALLVHEAQHALDYSNNIKVRETPAYTRSLRFVRLLKERYKATPQVREACELMISFIEDWLKEEKGN